MNTNRMILNLALITAILLVACQGTGTSILKVSLANGGTLNLTASDIQAITPLDVDYIGKDGATTKYSGVSLTELLINADIVDVSQVTFVAKDGYTAELSGTELLQCQNCIVAFQDDGGLRLVMPGLSGKFQVKDLIEIQVK